MTSVETQPPEMSVTGTSQRACATEAIIQFLTPPEVAKLLRVSSQKVLGWIRRGELIAVDVGNRTRPRFRVSRDALDAFIKSREVQPPRPTVRRKRPPPEGGPIDPELGAKLLKKNEAVKIGNKFYRVWDGVILFY